MFWGGVAAVLAILLLTTDPEGNERSPRTIQPDPPARPMDSISDAKTYMLQLVSNEREKAGLMPVHLGNNPAAQFHAEAAIQYCYNSHWDRWGLKPSHRYSLSGGTGSARENISGHDVCTGPGDGYRPLYSLDAEIADSMAGLMTSRGHRENILSPAHTHLNAGLAYDRYNISVVQHFSAEYITYREKPTIDDSGTLHLTASSDEASFDIGNFASVQIFYDHPPKPLTRGQLYRTYSSCPGILAAYIVRPRQSVPQGGTVEVEERNRTRRCTNPYDIDPSTEVPQDPAKAQAEWDTIKAKALDTKEIVEHVHKVAAKSLDRNASSIEVEADLSEVLDFHGPGIYTVVIRGRPDHMNKNATLSEQAIFWNTQPPEGNPYQQMANTTSRSDQN